MKILFNIITAAILTLLTTGCSLSTLADIEPTGWEKQEFEREVKRAVAHAVRAPGIDNGSTIIITNHGDTLIAPVDTTLRRADIRTVYIDIQSPVYPRRISSRSVEMMMAILVTAGIGIFILLILLGVFIVIVRRQHGRSKTINHAIDQGYPLPESFYTGTPSAPAITVNQVRASDCGPAHDHRAPEDGAHSAPFTPSDEAPEPPAYDNGRVFDMGAVKDALKNATNIPANPSVKDLRNGIITAGIGVVLFIFFASMHQEGLGCLAGGVLIVLGGAKLLTYFFTKKF